MIEMLTERENEVYRLVVQGVKQEVIALMLNISVKTVSFHVANIKMKLNAKTKYDLLVQLLDPSGTRLEYALKERLAA